MVVDGPIPYKPDAMAMKRKYAANALREDAEVKCYLPGVPRVMYMPYPVQIVQSTDTILMMSEFASAVRTIYVNGTARPPADTWMGWSNAKWDGETLVIDSRGFMGGTVGALDEEGAVHVRFLDRAGNYHTDGLHVVERIRRTDADHLEYEATIEDPNVYTRPWTTTIPARRWTANDAPDGWHYEATLANLPGKPPLAERYERICVENNTGFGGVAVTPKK